LKINFIKMFV